MAAQVVASSLSALMQAELQSLSEKGANAEEVTMAEMCDAVAQAIADEVNATIVATYTAHIHITTATVGASGTAGVIAPPAP